MPLKLFIIRHPETINNRNNIIEGPMGGELSEEGKSQITPAVKKLITLKINKDYWIPTVLRNINS